MRLVSSALLVLAAWPSEGQVWTVARLKLPVQGPASSVPWVLGSESRLHIVESLPLGDFALQPLPHSHSTAEALVALFNAATTTIDVLAMYWNLGGLEDRKQYTPAQMSAFGADQGANVLDALANAVRRNVSVRIVGSKSSQFTPTEIEGFVHDVRLWDADHWYGGGIMHQKMVVVDGTHAYVGSANMDWKSLTQVMEVGVVVEAQPVVAQDMQRLFNLWWAFADPALVVSPTHTPVTVFSEAFQVDLRLPPWSAAAQPKAPGPFDAAATSSIYNKTHNLHTKLNDRAAGVFLSAAPEAAAARYRTTDEDALVYTIRSATTTLALSVMDFVPFASYPLATHPHGSIHWPALTDALLGVVFARPVVVRLLISHWAHSSPVMHAALRQLQAQAATCPQHGMGCLGRLEIRLLEVPGWNTTGTFPPFTRVNHAKFIVSDKRVNVGTSNMEWGYFYNTAGTSFNTDHPDAISSVQAIFDRNWNSPYAQPLSP
ncbi:phospholipase D, Pi-sPLD-like-1 [Achlya hypogyna]|nr:phospholipase D, Pi-sPLD-like-1 [Achlya hypogyna]